MDHLPMKPDLPAGTVELEHVMRTVRFPVSVPWYGAAQVTVKRSPAAMRAAILRYERAVGALPQVALALRHFHMAGRVASHVYAREMTIPKGVTLVGRVHKYETMNIVSKGRIIIASEEGVREIAAPYIFVSKPGAKRAGYALEDTLWTTIHLTDELDAAKIEDDLGTVTYEQFWEFLKENGHAPPRLRS
jgi:hypothetical protein